MQYNGQRRQFRLDIVINQLKCQNDKRKAREAAAAAVATTILYCRTVESQTSAYARYNFEFHSFVTSYSEKNEIKRELALSRARAHSLH